jgi:hypothetical protein
VTKAAADKTKQLMEKEIKTLKDKVTSCADVPSKKLQEAKEQNRGEHNSR